MRVVRGSRYILYIWSKEVWKSKFRQYGEMKKQSAGRRVRREKIRRKKMQVREKSRKVAKGFRISQHKRSESQQTATNRVTHLTTGQPLAKEGCTKQDPGAFACLYSTCLHLHDPEKTYHTFAHQHARKELGCQAKTVVLLPHPAGHGHGSHAPTLRWTGWLGCLTWWSIKSDFIKIRIHPVTIFDSITAGNDIKHWHGIRRFHGMVWNWCVCVWINDINAFTRLYRQYSLITHNTW